MTPQDKVEIKRLFEEKRKRLELSQEQAATQAGSKGSTVSAVFSGKYGADDTAIYKLLADWVGFNQGELKIVETKNFLLMNETLNEARNSRDMFAIIGEAGYGKTVAQRYYAQENKNCFLIRCEEFWLQGDLLNEILRQLGRSGIYKPKEAFELIYNTLVTLDKPLLMFDEPDKLKNIVLRTFISMFNRFENKCAITLTGTQYLHDRLKRGKDLNKKGFKELWSRIGGNPIQLHTTSVRDIRKILFENGITDEVEVNKIISESKGDLRAVKRGIQRNKIELATAA